MGRWEFYTQIIEMADTARKHAAEFAAAHLDRTSDKQEAGMLAYHLMQAQKHAHNLAGERPVTELENVGG
jgi:hypothetical protein